MASGRAFETEQGEIREQVATRLAQDVGDLRLNSVLGENAVAAELGANADEEGNDPETSGEADEEGDE